jgi:hypothetical protein
MIDRTVRDGTVDSRVRSAPKKPSGSTSTKQTSAPQRTQAHENPRLTNAADLLEKLPECDLAKTDDRLSRLVQPFDTTRLTQGPGMALRWSVTGWVSRRRRTTPSASASVVIGTAGQGADGGALLDHRPLYPKVDGSVYYQRGIRQEAQGRH